MSEPLDLDARRAARREARGGTPSVRFGGEDFALPADLDVDLADGFNSRLQDGTARDALEFLFGAEQWERFWSHKPTYDDLADLLDAIPRMYGLGDDDSGDGLGKSAASSASSKSTGKRSRRTSSGTTRSTSQRLAGVPSLSESAVSSHS